MLTLEKKVEAEANAEQELAKEEAAKFGGCYGAIVSMLLHLMPKRVIL